MVLFPASCEGHCSLPRYYWFPGRRDGSLRKHDTGPSDCDCGVQCISHTAGGGRGMHLSCLPRPHEMRAGHAFPYIRASAAASVVQSLALQVWLRPLANGAAAVVLHNPGDSKASITVSFSQVPKNGWTAHTSLEVRDLWRKASMGTATGQYTAKDVPSHGSVFLKLTPAGSAGR